MFMRLCLAFILFVGMLTAAEAQFMIEQGKVVIAATPGDRVNDSVTVHNTTKDDIDVKVYWEEFEYTAPFDGTKNFMPAGMAKHSASKWISYMPQEFHLPAFATKKIDYTINVPADMTAGHYGVLFFERASPDQVKDGTGVNLVMRMGSLFFIEPKEKDKTAAVENFKIVGDKLTGDFLNQTSVVLIPENTYYIMDVEGLVVDRGAAKKLYTPAGATAPFEIPLPESLKPGSYTFFFNADLEDGDVVVREADIVKDAEGKVVLGAIR